MPFENMDELRKKYESKLKGSFGEEPGFSSKKKKDKSGGEPDADDDQSYISSDYYNFKKESVPAHFTLYEKACNLAEQVLKIEPDKAKIAEMKEAIETCHLQITPAGATSFSILMPLIIALVTITLTYLVPALLYPGKESMFFVVFSLFVGLGMILPLQKLPFFLANSWRMKASNQMVLCVFYVVTYMRHTSNLERAISFASDHLTPPLSLDLKKVLWDVESEKFSSLKESLDEYLQTWRKFNMEFVEAIHLIESSLYESSETRRLNALDKSLNVILDETYEKMLHYAHNLKGPLSALHMLGIILPILGLVILPLMVSFMPEVKWYHLVSLYNFVLPALVLLLSKSILSTRPTGYGDTDISESNPELRKYRYILIPIGKLEIKISPLIVAVIVFGILFLIGTFPLILHASNPDFDIVLTAKGLKQISTINDPEATHYFLGYRNEIIAGTVTDTRIGPFGLGALILSIVFVVAFGVSTGLYYSLKSKNVIKIRDQSKKLEQEFAAALFQLGNRLGDGLPAEIAFNKAAEVMEGTVSGKFFEQVSMNITKLGMNVEQAVFDEKKGALIYYPSNLIESSMKVLVESSKKGPMVASQALINVSEYIKQIHRVDERLKDLMADIISDMRSQIKFLTPAIAGIVVGITSMITQIIGNLSRRLGELATEASQAGNVGAGTSLLSMFGTGVPTYFFQIMVGMYVFEITFIMTLMINGIENGSDKLSEKYMLGSNLKNTILTYAFITLAVSILFNMVAGSILSSMQG
ncbi:hypothetical protein JW711_03695 [Candidatus Woesearchaeota archaeon]|nr:hypothetical protein [Candidatus Woesearchaeota archaeon]